MTSPTREIPCGPVPLDLEALDPGPVIHVSRLRRRDTNGHYDAQRQYARINGAVCDIVAEGIDRDEVIAHLLSTLDRMLNR